MLDLVLETSVREDLSREVPSRATKLLNRGRGSFLPRRSFPSALHQVTIYCWFDRERAQSNVCEDASSPDHPYSEYVI